MHQSGKGFLIKFHSSHVNNEIKCCSYFYMHACWIMNISITLSSNRFNISIKALWVVARKCEQNYVLIKSLERDFFLLQIAMAVKSKQQPICNFYSAQTTLYARKTFFCGTISMCLLKPSRGFLFSAFSFSLVYPTI